MKTLYSIHHSPWSERARFVLLHHGFEFVEKEHVPLIGEIALRFRAKKWTGVSVPLLVDDGGTVVQGSLAIAEHLDKSGKGKGKTLFPDGKRELIGKLFEDLEEPMRAARERFVKLFPTSREAQMEALPPLLRKVPLAGAMANMGASFIARKYAANDGNVDERIRNGMLRVRDALAGRDYVVGADLSFADILCASVLQTVSPFDDTYLDFPPATRKLWFDAPVAHEFADLMTWRDALYAKHRPIDPEHR
ncbi:MAG: glutathione S-transferase family protein [Polyangiaceae bacterium]